MFQKKMLLKVVEEVTHSSVRDALEVKDAFYNVGYDIHYNTK